MTTLMFHATQFPPRIANSRAFHATVPHRTASLGGAPVRSARERR